MQMFYVLLALGQTEFALDMQDRALRQRSIYRMAGTVAPSIRLLALMGPGNMLDNTPFEFLLDLSDIRLDLLFCEPEQPLPDAIPDHDVAVVAVGESDKNLPLLQHLGHCLTHWPRPVLNPPQHIMHCARDTSWQLLHDIPGVQMPHTQRLQRAQIKDLRYPVTIRPVGTQGGQGLTRLNTQGNLDAYLALHPDAWLYVADYVDYRSADGMFRKWRIVLIDGCPYVCHIAIANHWMVHYHSANMQLSVQKRDEEARLMAGFDLDFAVRHGAAFRAIAQQMGLDYAVIDCAQAHDGRLLVFEVDSRGWIHATDPVDIFAYKPAVMQKAFDAFRTMLLRRVAGLSHINFCCKLLKV